MGNVCCGEVGVLFMDCEGEVIGEGNEVGIEGVGQGV